MPRKARSISSIGIYHVILRSVNKQIIFEEEFDYQKFLFILSDSKDKYDVDIYAYCLMDNHIHLLLYASKDSISHFFQSLESRFVRWYNTKYERSGHLFQERFHSRVVENTDYYLNTLVYIHNNPVKAGCCRYPSEYRWSSYNAFYGAKNSLVNTIFSYQAAGSKEHLQRYFSTYSLHSSFENDSFLQDHPNSTFRLTDEKALEKFLSLTHFSSSHEIDNVPKRQRNEIVRASRKEGLSIRQISRIVGISIPTIIRICR